MNEQFTTYKLAGHSGFIRRFFNDFKISIEYPVAPQNILQMLKFTGYEDQFIKAYNYIHEFCNDDIEKYLHDYYTCRELLISTIKNNKAFQDLNQKGSAIYCTQPCNELKNKKHMVVYNEENINKYFLSIDIRNANFTALYYANPQIFNCWMSYEDWLKNTLKDADVYWHDYFSVSKYSRQVIFGQANPKLTICIEKSIITQICNRFFEIASDDIKEHISVDSFNADEIVFEISEEYFGLNDFTISLYDTINRAIKEVCPEIQDRFRKTMFQLYGYKLINETEQRELETFYIKEDDINVYPKDLHCITKRNTLLACELLNRHNKIVHPILFYQTIDGIMYKIEDIIKVKQI